MEFLFLLHLIEKNISYEKEPFPFHYNTLLSEVG